MKNVDFRGSQNLGFSYFGVFPRARGHNFLGIDAQQRKANKWCEHSPSFLLPVGPESKIPGSEFSHVAGKVFLKFRCNSSCKFSTPDFVISLLCETCSGRRLNLKVEVKSVRTKWKMLIFGVPRIWDFPNSECSARAPRGALGPRSALCFCLLRF